VRDGFVAAPPAGDGTEAAGDGDGNGTHTTRELVAMRWGLIPAWADGESDGYKRINARIESVAQRPSYREAFAGRRCAVPVTGFYEWARRPGAGTTRPLWIHPADGGVMLLAGLWDRWIAGDGRKIDSFTIVTRDAVGPLRAIHDRMPVELPMEVLDEWLAPARPISRGLRASLAGPVSVAHLETRPVSRRVGSPSHDDADCIAPTTADRHGEQLDLFGDGAL